MKKPNIEQLIDRFFDGNTTRSEEQQLYDFFLRGNVPSHLSHYASTFQSLATRQQPIAQPQRGTFRRWAVAASIAALCCLGAVAAGVLFFENSKSRTHEASPQAPIEATAPALFVFDNVELEQVAATLGQHYRLKPVFENEEVKHKRIYLKVNKKKTIEEVVEQLNEFDGITVTVSDGKLIIK